MGGKSHGGQGGLALAAGGGLPEALEQRDALLRDRQGELNKIDRN